MTPKEKTASPHMPQKERIKPEFSRCIPLARTGRPLEERIEASPAERAALKQRLGLVALERLACVFRLRRGQDPAVVMAEGHLQAEAEQACIITGEPVAERIDEHFSLRFIPAGEMPDDKELDIEALLQEDADDVPYEGRMIDLGEAAAEQLALCLAPYPRCEGAGLESFVDVTPAGAGGEGGDSASNGTHDAAEGRQTPFAALKALRGRG